MTSITRNQETEVITILGEPLGRKLIGIMNQIDAAGGIVGPVVPPLINNTVPVYSADTNYTKTIGGVVVTHITTAAVQQFWEVTLSLLPKHIHALRSEGVTHPKDLAQFSSTEF